MNDRTPVRLAAAPKGGSSDHAPEVDWSQSLAFAWSVHANLQEMVKLADQKAATLMGATGVIVALLGSNLIDRLGKPPWSGALIWTGATTLVLLLGGALFSLLVLAPRFPHPKVVPPVEGAPNLTWALQRYRLRPAEYLRALHEVTDGEVVADVAYENLKIGWLLEKKWRWLRWAIWTYCAAFPAWALTIVLAALRG